MRWSSSSCLQMQQYLEPYLNGYSWCPLPNKAQRYTEKIKHVLAEQQGKFSAKILNPFNLCPARLTIWFPVRPSVSIGVSFASLQEINIYLRQAIDPTFANIFVFFKVLKFRVPFSLVLLALFSSVGLFINGKIYNMLQAANNEVMMKPAQGLVDFEERIEDTAEKEHKSFSKSLSPFDISSRSVTIFLPIQNFTTIGIVFHDLEYMSISISQALEPNSNIFSSIRFIHFQVPFALDLLTLFLLIGLFFNGGINKVEQGVRDEVVREVKEVSTR